jgi:hypothetical protein
VLLVASQAVLLRQVLVEANAFGICRKRAVLSVAQADVG